MFNNNINQTYDFKDASQEIIIMLLGAFLLGCLLTWLLNKLFSKDYSSESTLVDNAYRYDHQNTIDNRKSALVGHKETERSESVSEVRIVDKPSQKKLKKPTVTDDLTKISSIDTKMQTELKAYGITTFAQLRDINVSDLKNIQKSQKTHKREIETWPHQASLAAKGDWKKLNDYQGFIERIKKASNSSKAQQTHTKNRDNLSKLEGINPEIEEILNEKAIFTYKQLSHIDSETLKNHIIESNPSNKEIETESWPHQAAMAEKNQWEELKIYQDFMHADSDIVESNDVEKDQVSSSTNKSDTIHVSDEENYDDHDDLKKIQGIDTEVESLLNDKGIYTFSQLYNSDKKRLNSILADSGKSAKSINPDSWPHQAGMANRAEWDDLESYQHFVARNNKAVEPEMNHSEESTSDKNDDLKKIEGIGPKIEEVLNEGGINTYVHLYNSNEKTLRGLLDDAGNQFKMHDPKSWPHQAGMASRAEWDDLKSYQRSVVSEKETLVTEKQSSPNVANANVVYTKDDLKKIEGIGPKIQELLNKAGITTFKQLSECSRDEIKMLLNEAGPQFRMHEPESWPHQSKLASNNEWDELEKYKSYLIKNR